jgi:hypothetical protein
MPSAKLPDSSDKKCQKHWISVLFSIRRSKLTILEFPWIFVRKWLVQLSTFGSFISLGLKEEFIWDFQMQAECAFYKSAN